MHGATVTPAGSRRPPISIGSLSLRTTSERIGRRRSVSLQTASAYSLAAGLGLLAQPRQRLRVANQALDRPGERARGGLVTGHEQGHQLVAQLLV